MDFDELIKDGAIKHFKSSTIQINDLLLSAENDIKAVNELTRIGHYGLSRDTAYEAMLKCGMALMFYYGYRPRGISHHITIVKFTKLQRYSVNQKGAPTFIRATFSIRRRLLV